jgi:hypothetical protein
MSPGRTPSWHNRDGRRLVMGSNGNHNPEVAPYTVVAIEPQGLIRFLARFATTLRRGILRRDVSYFAQTPDGQRHKANNNRYAIATRSVFNSTC